MTTLSPGSRIGVYEVVGLLGAGGMGEVYRARDTRLGREVAIKVMSDAMAGDVDRVARFEREAKSLAALNHPHIASLFGLEESASRRVLVMELVEGDTLADRVAHGPLPIAEALAIARQIADALEAAHERDIVHRDLKPANVKVTTDGAVKVLDFGLAKAMDRSGGSSPDLSLSPALSMRDTQAGMIYRGHRLRRTVSTNWRTLPDLQNGGRRTPPCVVARRSGVVLYARPGQSILAVPITTTPTFAFGDAVIITRPFLNAPPTAARTYDVARAGQRILGLRTDIGSNGLPVAPQIQVVLNWLEELKQRVPTR